MKQWFAVVTSARIKYIYRGKKRIRCISGLFVSPINDYDNNKYIDCRNQRHTIGPIRRIIKKKIGHVAYTDKGVYTVIGGIDGV